MAGHRHSILDENMYRSRREFLATVGVVGAGAGLFTEVTDSKEAIGASPPEPEIDSVSLLLNWRTSGLHVPYYAAAERGYYADAGLELEQIESGQGSDFSAKQVGMGNVEFGITSSDQLLNINSRELSPRCVSVVMQRSPVVVFAAREQFGTELTDPTQLQDRTIGSGPGMVRQMTRSYLDRHEVLDDVEYVDTGFDTVQQLLTGEIAAAGGVFSDVVDARHQGYEIDTLAVAETIPSYGHVIASDAEFASKHPAAVRAFVRATARGAVWATRHPEAAIDILVDRQPELEQVRENQRDKWELLSTEYMLSDAVDKRGWGWSRSDPWKETHSVLAEGEFLDGQVDPETVWTNEYIDTEYEYIKNYADMVSS